MILYVTSTQSYSETRVNGIFSERELAEQAMKLRPDIARRAGPEDPTGWNEIAEWEVDSTKFIIKPGAEMKLVYTYEINIQTGKAYYGTTSQEPKYEEVPGFLSGKDRFSVVSNYADNIRSKSLVSFDDAKHYADKARLEFIRLNPELAKSPPERSKSKDPSTLDIYWCQYTYFSAE